MDLRLVIIESPYAAKKPDGTWDAEGVEENLRYLRACMHDCIQQGEAPYASHALYTQPGVLNDQIPGERELGIRSGFAWNRQAEASIFYVDRGLSSGMIQGIKNAVEDNRLIEIRALLLEGPGYGQTTTATSKLLMAIGEAYLEKSRKTIEQRKEWAEKGMVDY